MWRVTVGLGFTDHVQRDQSNIKRKREQATRLTRNAGKAHEPKDPCSPHYAEQALHRYVVHTLHNCSSDRFAHGCAGLPVAHSLPPSTKSHNRYSHSPNYSKRPHLGRRYSRCRHRWPHDLAPAVSELPRCAICLCRRPAGGR